MPLFRVVISSARLNLWQWVVSAGAIFAFFTCNFCIHRVRHCVKHLMTDIGKIAGADYDIANLGRELKRISGQTTLGQLKRRVLVTAFDLDNGSADPHTRKWKPRLFHNFPGSDSDGRELAYKVGPYTP